MNLQQKFECYFLKLQYFATSCEELTHWKDSDAGRDWRQEEKGMPEDEMAGWHHREKTPTGAAARGNP